MPRPEKVEAVEDIKSRLTSATAVFVTEYRGLSVGQQQKLRRSLAASEADYKIVKMTLARRAVTEVGYDTLLASLEGPTGLAFAKADPVATARALRDFAQENALLILKGGMLGEVDLSADRVRQLADIEPREVLLAKMAGLFQAPLARTAGLFAAVLRGTANVVSQLIDKRTAAGESLPAPEVAVEPEAAAEPEAAVEPEAAAEPEAIDSDTNESTDEAPAEPAADDEQEA